MKFMTSKYFYVTKCLSAVICFMFTPFVFAGGTDFSSYEWEIVNPEASWSPRAGLHVVNLKNELYLMGGRTPIDPATLPVPGASQIWGDVWKSADRGLSWEQILETDDQSHWPARAYFQAVSKGNNMYVLGGRISVS